MRKNKRPVLSEPEQAAGNGLLDRRLFLTGTAAAFGSAAMVDHAGATEALPVEPWMKTPGSPFMRYPMESRIAFIECAGNSAAMYQKEPAQLGVQPIHGLLSCAEWTGVRLATLLEDAGVDPRAQWILAEGADASGMSRSVPLEK